VSLTHTSTPFQSFTQLGSGSCWAAATGWAATAAEDFSGGGGYAVGRRLLGGLPGA